MKATLLAYSVADTMQWKEEIDGQNCEDLFKKSIEVIKEKSVEKSKKVFLRMDGVDEIKWIQDNLCIPRSKQKGKQA